MAANLDQEFCLDRSGEDPLVTSVMPETLDDILDSPFHFAALRAYMEQAAVSSGPPCPNATRQRAYRHYENALAERRGEPPRYSGD